MSKKSSKINAVLLILFAASSFICVLSASGRIPQLNNLGSEYWGYVSITVTPGDRYFYATYHNNNGLQFDLTGGQFLGSEGVNSGFYTGPSGSTTALITVFDVESGYSVSSTVAVQAGQTTTLNMNVVAPYTPTPTISPTTAPFQPTPTPVTVPTTVNLYVNNGLSTSVAYAERITMSVYTTPAIKSTMATLTAYINGVAVFSQPVSLNGNGMGGELLQPHSIFNSPYSDVTWKATVNGVSSNSVVTYMNPIPTPEPTQNPYASPTASPYPSSTPVNYVTPTLKPLVTSSEVAIISGIVAALSLIALLWYNLRK